MDERIVDVLGSSGSDKDRVIGQESLDVVHAQGLRHISIHSLVLDAQDRVYIRQRHQGGMYPQLWTNSTGTHLLTRRWRRATVIASLETTLNLKPSLVKVEDIGTFEVHDQYENELCLLFRTRTNEPVQLNPIAGTQGTFATITEIERLVAQSQTTPHLAEAIKLL